jgi:hypothetical protein
LQEFLLRQEDIKFLQQKFNSNRHISASDLENEIHNFGNIIGAFIMYVLIESLRPNERLIRREARDQIWESFLRKAVSIPNLLQRFSEQLPETIDFYRVIIGSDNVSFNKLYNAYDNVYPGFTNFINNSFKDYVNSLTPVETCDHEWIRIKAHKLGDRYLCRKCLGLANEEDFEPISN